MNLVLHIQNGGGTLYLSLPQCLSTGNGIQCSTYNVIHSVARHNPHLRDRPDDEFVYFRGYGEDDWHQDGVYQKSIERKKIERALQRVSCFRCLCHNARSHPMFKQMAAHSVILTATRLRRIRPPIHRDCSLTHSAQCHTP